MIQKLLRSERGSAMTEFIIGLPVFVLLFVGIASFVRIGQAGVLVKAEAHAKMWQKAIPVTTNLNPGWAMSPITAAGEAAVFHNNTDGSALDYALDSGSGLAAVTGLSGGIMAESYSRVKPVDIVENIGAANEKVTYKLDESYLIPDKQSIAYDLMNDGVNFSASGGGGVLGALNGLLSFAGARPALAAGVRYGISGDFATRQVTLFNKTTTTFEARSHVTNAPRPTSRYITVAVVRLAMEKEDRYNTAIAFTFIPDMGAIIETATDWLKGAIKAAAKFKLGKWKRGKQNAGRQYADQIWSAVPCRGSLCK